jgi:copper homeostasis protein
VTIFEIAVDDVAGGRAAEEAGAHRVELCAGLADGGTTPSIGFAREVAEQLKAVPLMVLIRPRAGDFVYTPEELRVMLRDIEALRDVPVAGGIGFVIGALEASGRIDVAAVSQLVSACADAPTTFHRAFDGTPDLARSLDTLVELGVSRVLTSGGRRTALEGAGVIRSLVDRAEGSLTVVAGGAIRADNVASVLTATGVTEAHLRAAVARPSVNEWSNPEQDYLAVEVSATDGDLIRTVLEAAVGHGA